MRAVLALGVAGAVLEAGCLWVWWFSPGLTAIYNPDYTRAFFARWPWLTVPSQSFADVHDMVACLLVGLALMSLGYVGALVALRQATRAASAGVVIGGAIVFRVTLALLPGLFSTDIFSYVMYGRISVVYGQNPYLHPPADFPDDPFLAWVFPFWRGQPTVYGPVWTDFSWLLSALTSDLSNFDQVLAYRAALVLAEVATLGLIWLLLSAIRPDQRLAGFAMFAWNPLVLFDLVGASHNDVAMLLLMLLGLVPFARGSAQAIGLAGLTVSALVKFTSGLLVPIAALLWAAQGASPNSKTRRMVTGLVVIAAVAVGFGWQWLLKTDALPALNPTLVLNSTPDLIALTFADQLLAPAGMDRALAQETTRFWMRILTRLVFGGYFVWELWRIGRRPTLQVAVESATRALLILPLLVLTWVWSWYFSWSLALAVLIGWSSRLARLVVAYTVLALPVVYAHQYLNEQLSGLFVLVFTLGPLGLLLSKKGYSGSQRPTAQPQPVPAGDR